MSTEIVFFLFVLFQSMASNENEFESVLKFKSWPHRPLTQTLHPKSWRKRGCGYRKGFGPAWCRKIFLVSTELRSEPSDLLTFSAMTTNTTGSIHSIRILKMKNIYIPTIPNNHGTQQQTTYDTDATQKKHEMYIDDNASNHKMEWRRMIRKCRLSASCAFQKGMICPHSVESPIHFRDLKMR